MNRAKTLEARITELERKINQPLSPLELAARAGVSKSTVYRWLEQIHQTKLKPGQHYRRTGRRWVILDPDAIINAFSD